LRFVRGQILEFAVYSIQPQAIAGSGNGSRLLARHGGNAAAVLEQLAASDSESYERVSQILSAILPGLIKVRSDRQGSEVKLVFAQVAAAGTDRWFEAAAMSDGTLRALGVLLAVYQHPRPSLLVIEEPEATMHPAAALGVMQDLLQNASRETQVIVTTHSTDLLDAKWIQDRHLRMVSWRDGETRVTTVSENSRKYLQDRLMCAGEMLRTNTLYGQEDRPAPQIKLFEELR
jgi:predicted ATPase